MAKLKTLWCCKECGHTQIKWSGNCFACKKWDTLTEEVEVSDKEERFTIVKTQGSRPLPLKEISIQEMPRLETKMVEMDHLLGGGIVPGSLTLIAGDPGIGKSTLLLQISESFAKQGKIVLYVCGEESAQQTSMRAKRLGIQSETLFLLSETLFSTIKKYVEQLKPDILIIDSIQIVYKAEIPSSPGSVTQVREIAMEFLHLAKGMGIATFLIGHVTKSGEIAGPRVLEHIVDTVLEFEGDRQHGFRILRSVKNRFGPTENITLFQMTAQGLAEIRNPSEVFMQERIRESAGAVIVPTVEGARAILIEVQALVAPSAFATSTRRSSGLDQNRLALLLAILEKRVGYALHHNDLFVSVAGGMKIVEPALDLGIVMAVASSFSNRPIDPSTVVIGEVGLGGEVRRVPRIENRIKEAHHMGFSRAIVPKKNLEALPSSLKQKIEVVGVDFVEEVIDVLIR